MPVYEYQCNDCGHRTQKLQRVGEDSTGRECPSCGSGKLKKLFSVFSSGAGERQSCGPESTGRFT